MFGLIFRVKGRDSSPAGRGRCGRRRGDKTSRRDLGSNGTARKGRQEQIKQQLNRSQSHKPLLYTSFFLVSPSTSTLRTRCLRRIERAKSLVPTTSTSYTADVHREPAAQPSVVHHLLFRLPCVHLINERASTVPCEHGISPSSGTRNHGTTRAAPHSLFSSPLFCFEKGTRCGYKEI